MSTTLKYRKCRPDRPIQWEIFWKYLPPGLEVSNTTGRASYPIAENARCITNGKAYLWCEENNGNITFTFFEGQPITNLFNTLEEHYDIGLIFDNDRRYQ